MFQILERPVFAHADSDALKESDDFFLLVVDYFPP